MPSQARPVTAPVAERALIARINRALRKDMRQLRTARHGSPTAQQLGHHYLVDISRNFVVGHDVDLEGIAKELGCLKAWERLVSEE
jgi:hypothetical protein